MRPCVFCGSLRRAARRGHRWPRATDSVWRRTGRAASGRQAVEVAAARLAGQQADSNNTRRRRGRVRAFRRR